MFSHQRKTLSHILDSLRKDGIPESVINLVKVDKDKIYLHGATLSYFKYLDFIDQALFYHCNKEYAKHKHVLTDNGSIINHKYQLSLSVHGTAALIVYGLDASQALRKHLRGMLSNEQNPVYTLHEDSGAVFRGGNVNVRDDNHGYIYVEFQKSQGAQAFLDHLNATFKQKVIVID